MRITKAGLSGAIVLAVVSLAVAAQRLVPSFLYPTIQSGINAANNGDTISVWGPPQGQPLIPPWTYYEHIADTTGESLFIVNRSFIGEIPGYPPSWEYVTIEGTPTGPVVTMTGNDSVVPRVVLKGFTITGGGGTYGGGIYCRDVVAVLEKNHVHHCAATFGGGICHWQRDNTSAETLYVKNCLIDSNAAGYGGGGIYIDGAIYHSPTLIRLQGNEICGNTAVQKGGGVYVRRPPSQQEGQPLEPADDTILMDNAVHHNRATGGAMALGGGIYSEDMYSAWVKRNQITDNQPDGICMYASDEVEIPLRLGLEGDPGFNVLMGNGSGNGVWCDYHLAGKFASYPTLVVGNYWGTLDAATIRSHIEMGETQAYPRLDPIAASGKWFSVDASSRCTTSVIVTGDLRVDSGAVLWIEPGDTFRFATWPDDSLPGGDPNRTDLILAPGCSLQAIGTDPLAGSILFTQWHNPGPPYHWYGIRLKPGSYAKLRYCDVDSAYCGVEVQSAFAEIESSKVHDCEFAGVYNFVDGHVNVLGSFVTGNGVYGVRCWFLGQPQEPSRVESNQLIGNGYAGVSFNLTTPTDGALDGAAHKILYNHIVAGPPPGNTAPYGVETWHVADSVRIDSNFVSGFHQAGIALWTSLASVVGDTVRGDTVNGIACFLGSHPEVRWNTVKLNRLSGIACFAGSDPHVRWNTVDSNPIGVYCDGTSFPDLGTEEDSGYNSILFDNVVWVSRTEDMAIWLTAQYNWWGTDRPDTFPGKFLARVTYNPWLHSAPGGGDGQQSTGSASSLLQTGLGRPLPMPMRGTARIPFQVAHAGPVSLDVVDVSGRVVRTLVRSERAPGRYNVTWDRSDNSGRLMPEGVFFLRFEAGARRDVQKLVVMH